MRRDEPDILLEKALSAEITRQNLQGTPMTVALSGGPDSTALLIALDRVLRHASLRAIHINHHLRGKESNVDEAFCRSLCERHEIPLEVFSVDFESGSRRKETSIEERARLKRLEIFRTYLARHGGCLCLGHTADDLVENFFLRISRGASPQGVLGMRVFDPPYFRPFLSLAKQDVVAYLRKMKQRFCVDRTNEEIHFDRNYIRKVILVPLKKRRPQMYGAIYRYLKLLGQESDALDDVCERRLSEIVEKKGDQWILDFEKGGRRPMDIAFFGRLLSLFLARHYPELRTNLRDKLSERKLAAIKDHVLKGGCRSMHFSKDFVIDVVYGKLIFPPASLAPGGISGSLMMKRVSPREAEVKRVGRGRPVRVRWGNYVISFRRVAMARSLGKVCEAVRVERPRVSYYLNESEISFPIKVRGLRRGDRFCPFGLKGRTKKVSACLIGKKIPKGERGRVPVVCDKHRILLVHGVDIDYRLRLSEKAKKSYALRVQILESPLKN